MDFYRYRHFLKKRIDYYFGFTSQSETNYNKKSIKRIYITGKMEKEQFLFWLLFDFAFAFIGGASLSKQIGIVSYLISFIIAIIAVFIVVLKSKKLFQKITPDSTVTNLYDRELPSNLRPAHVRLLMEDGLIDEISLAGTLLDLIDRGYLKLIVSNREKSDLFDNIFHSHDYMLKKTDRSQEDLFAFEKYLITWFLEYSDGNQINQKQLKHALLEDSENQISPSDKMKHWQALVMMSFPMETYYQKRKRSEKMFLYVLFIFLGFIPFFSYIGTFFSIYGLGCLFFTTPAYVLTKKGVFEKAKWLNFKNYLNDFGMLENKTAEMVALWDYYLTYSVVLELDSKASKELRDFFGDKIFYSSSRNYFICSSEEDIEELKMPINEWTQLFEQKREEELNRYKKQAKK